MVNTFTCATVSYTAVFLFPCIFAARYARTNNREKLGLIAKTKHIRRGQRVTTKTQLHLASVKYIIYAQLHKQLHFRAFNTKVR